MFTHTEMRNSFLFPYIFVLAEILNPRIITENLRKQLSLYKYVDKNNLLNLCVLCVDTFVDIRCAVSG